jgi:hypothetical protein
MTEMRSRSSKVCVPEQLRRCICGACLQTYLLVPLLVFYYTGTPRYGTSPQKCELPGTARPASPPIALASDSRSEVDTAVRSKVSAQELFVSV